MYPYYGGPQRQLHQDDIDGIQAIYGSAQWFHNRTIQRVFTSHHSQNCWAFIQGVGWKKVEPGSPNGTTNKFVTLCKARGHNTAVSIYVEDDTIRMMYL